MRYEVFQIDATANTWGFKTYPDDSDVVCLYQEWDPSQPGFVTMDQTTATTQAQIACGQIANPYHASTRHISRLQFLQRLTTAERAALYSNQAGDPVLNDFMYMFDKAEYIDLDEPTNAQALQYFVSKGYLTSDRPAVLLA